MDGNIIEQFKAGWLKELSSHELPNLDFLGQRDLALEQFRYSLAVIKDCLTTLQLEVFIVKFLRKHLLSDQKFVDGDLSATIDDVVNGLYSIFPARTRNLSEGSYYSQFMKTNFAKKRRQDISKFQFSDTGHATPTSEKQQQNFDRSYSLPSQATSKTRQNEHGNTDRELNEKQQLGGAQNAEQNAKNVDSKSKNASDVSRRLTSPSAQQGSQTGTTTTSTNASPTATSPSNKVTIYTPVDDKHIELKVTLSGNSGAIEVASDKSSTTTPTSESHDIQVDEKGSKALENYDQNALQTSSQTEDELQSSGNELDTGSFHSDLDRFSSDNSGSTSPVQRGPTTTYFGNSNSDEVLDILPISSRHSFYNVNSSLEKTHFGTAEHIYEDIEKYRAQVDNEFDQARHVSQPELRKSDDGLEKTFNVGLPKKPDEADDVFVRNNERSPVEEHNQTSNSLSLAPAPATSLAHKRSSSDAGVSYAIRQNTNKQRQARRDRVAFQVNFDQPDITLADGHPLNIQQSPLEQTVDDAHKLHMRKWVVAGLVDSERGYLEALEKLMKPMKPIKASLTTSSPICSVFDYHKIYDKVDDLYQIHSHFLSDMEQRVANWGIKQIIGDLFTALVDQLDIYQIYIRNNKAAMDTIEKCRKNNEQFENIFSQEITLVSTQEIIVYKNLFRKPLERIARYILAMDDLIKYTPEDHPDYGLLQSFLERVQEFLDLNYSKRQSIRVTNRLTKKKKDRKLYKDAFVVELVDGQRKFRHLLLFSDVFVSAKLKVTNRSEQFAIKWYCPMQDIEFVPTANSESAPSVPVSSNFEIDNLKAKIAGIKADIRQEQGMCEGYTSKELEKRPAVRSVSTTSTASVNTRTSVNLRTKTMERLKRKLAEQEAALWLALPSLPLTIYLRSGKTHRFLFPTDIARGDWKREILAQKERVTGARVLLSPLEIQGLAETCLEMRTVRSLGSVKLKDDDNVFTGVFYVVVNSGKGFIKPLDFYVVLEVDYYGHYVRKARTRTSKASQDPTWEQGFHIEVEGTQFIKVLCYTKNRMMIGDELCGQGTIKLEKSELGDCHYHDYTVILDKQGCIMMSIQYSATLEGIHHRRSVSSSGVFGVSLEKVVEREKSEIPLVVIACCKEVERRGVEEVGIYRVSGVSSDVKRLKEKFDENSQEALVYISEADINAVAGTLKQYFRELPDPLFTLALYPKFMEALAISDDEEKKEKCLLDLLEQLSPSRKATALYLIDHLRRVSNHEDENKMSLGNLATVFGPNLLRPPPTEKLANSSKASASIAMASGTFNVMSQTSIFYWYLRSQNSRVKQSSTPEITRRLFPTKKPVVFARLSSQSEDKLI